MNLIQCRRNLIQMKKSFARKASGDRAESQKLHKIGLAVRRNIADNNVS
jgi:hypothetical protein